jgi:hypothetical protein
MKKLILLSFLLSNSILQANCLVKSEKIEEVSRIIQWQSEKGEVQNTALIQSTAKGEMLNEGSQTTFDYEAFIRPDEDGMFQLLPIPFFVIEMDQSRNTVYICAHIDSSDENKNLIVMYFLRNSEIKTVTPRPLPLMGIRNFFSNSLGQTPLVLAAFPFHIAEFSQSVLMDLFSDITQFGVDRVLIRGQSIELYSGGDPTQFEKYIWKRIVKIDKQ